MANYQPPKMNIFVQNKKNTTEMFDVLHNAKYAHQYAEIAQKAAVKYVTYYSDYILMPEDEEVTRYGNLNYKSNFNFTNLPQVKDLQRGSFDE